MVDVDMSKPDTVEARLLTQVGVLTSELMIANKAHRDAQIEHQAYKTRVRDAFIAFGEELGFFLAEPVKEPDLPPWDFMDDPDYESEEQVTEEHAWSVRKPARNLKPGERFKLPEDLQHEAEDEVFTVASVSSTYGILTVHTEDGEDFEFLDSEWLDMATEGDL